LKPSNCKTPGIAALASVSREAYPDHTAFDSTHPYYDPKSRTEAPTWYMVDVKFTKKMEHFVGLKLLQFIVAGAEGMVLPEYCTPDKVKAIRGTFTSHCDTTGLSGG